VLGKQLQQQRTATLIKQLPQALTASKAAEKNLA
jgi:hypothetical protein